MPYVFLIVGLFMIVLAVKPDATLDNFLTELNEDVTGSSGYLYWILAIVVVGSIGYVKKLQSVSTLLLILLVLAFILHNGGVFDKLKAEVK